jgi:hypothetical protein
MKALIPLVLFLLYAGLCYLQSGDSLNTRVNPESIDTNKAAVKIPLPSASPGNSNYKFLVSFFPDSKKIRVHESLVWVNKTASKTNEFYFHFYLNAYKSNRTIYARGHEIPEKSLTSIVLNNLTINGNKAKLKFVNTDEVNIYDSTVAKVALDNELNPGDSIHVEADYEFAIPAAHGRTGYVPGEDYHCIAQWFIKPGIFKDGKWICSPFFPYTEFFSDFGNYTVTIETPKEYQLATSGAKVSEESRAGERKACTFFQKNAIDFAWVATQNFEIDSYNVSNGTGTPVITQIFYPKTFSAYIPRYKAALDKSFRYFRSHFEGYPYKTFTLVITPPKSGMTGSMEYPGLVTISQALFSPEKSLEPEQTIIHEFAHQYFYGILANNEVYEAWLDEGFAEFLTDRILDSYKLRPSNYFRLFSRYPIKGIEFLSMEEIPMIYSLTDIKAPLYANDLKTYYNNLTAGSLADSSYLLTDENNYEAVSYAKGHVFLKTLEEYVGEQVMDKILKEYYQRFKYGHPTAGDFFRVCTQYSPKKIDWLISDYYSQSLICDYKINKIYKNAGSGYWVVEIKREGEARFPMRLDLYTDKDTLTKTIYMTNRYMSVQFKTKNEVIGAELDPKRKALFDINFANNSYFIGKQFGSSLYLSTRWFYWIQSVLLIFGGLA